jgi:hypothetical protein
VWSIEMSMSMSMMLGTRKRPERGGRWPNAEQVECETREKAKVNRPKHSETKVGVCVFQVYTQELLGGRYFSRRGGIENYDHRRSLLDWADCRHMALSRPNMAIRETELTHEARTRLKDLKCEGLVDPKIESLSVSAVSVSKAVQIAVTLSLKDDEGQCALARSIWSRKWKVSYRRGTDPSFKPAPNWGYDYSWKSRPWSLQNQRDHENTVSFLTELGRMAGDDADLEGTIASICPGQ